MFKSLTIVYYSSSCKPIGFLKCELDIPNFSAFSLIRETKSLIFPATCSASAFAASFPDGSKMAYKQSFIDNLSPELTPTLYKLTHSGFVFNNFYVPYYLSTIGGEFQSLTGLYPDSSILSISIM